MTKSNLPDIKRVFIYGMGGVGGYFGGRIAEKCRQPECAGLEIYFIARGVHLEAIKQHGITVKTPARIISARPTLATDNIMEIPAPDLILLCVKSYDLANAVTAIKPVIKDSTVIIPLLNGIDISQRILTILDEGIVLSACLYVGTHIESPGVISQSGGDGYINLGPDPERSEYTGDNVKTFFQKTGIQYQWFADPRFSIWEKYMFIAAFGMVTALYGESLGTLMGNDEHRNMVTGIMQEIYALSKKKGIDLPSDIVKKSINKARNFPAEARTSYQRDLESGAKYNEGDLYGGTIIRTGKDLGIPTPVTGVVYGKITDLYRKTV